MRKLENVTVTHVSFVDKAANKKEFFLTKAADEPTFETQVRLVTKADDPQQLVYGVVYEPEVEDAHGDFMDAETIEKAAHGFMENYQQIDKQHDFSTNAGKVVESYVAPVDMDFDGTTITKGSWVLVTKATDEMWESIQKGEFTGYSLAGTAQVEDVEKATQERFARGKTYRDVNAAIEAFRSATWSILDNYQADDADKIADIQGEIQELSELVATMPTQKSLTSQGVVQAVKSFFSAKKSKKQEENEMTQEELVKALGEALAPVNDRLEKLEKGQVETPTQTDETPEDEATVLDADAIAKAVAEAVKPLNDKVEKLEKARHSNVQEENYTESVEKSAVPSYVDAAFPID